MLKVGLGEDIHRLEKGGPLMLGGVPIEADVQSIAHSDGDALIHAVIDALLTPVSGKNIGTLFPDTDARYKSADSMQLLQQIKDDYLKGVIIHNLDCVIILDQPRLGAYLSEMGANIARILGLEPSQVGIKAKTSEKTAPDSVKVRVVVLMDTV